MLPRSLLLGVLAALASCAATGPAPDYAGCTEQLHAFEALAKVHGVSVSEPRAVPGHPALGSNRLLASFDPAQLSAVRQQAWLGRLESAGRKRRALLRLMLPDLPELQSGQELSAAALDRCASTAASRLPHDAQGWRDLHAAVQVPDDYLPSRRVLGLYPLTSLAAQSGIRKLQREVSAMFATPLEQLPRLGELQRWVPAAHAPAPPNDNPPTDALGPLPGDSAALESLFARHAPAWEIDVSGAYDRPGRPYFERTGVPRVDTAAPVTYRYASLTRVGGALRLQLNYLVWFDRRPARSAFDSLSGRLDGLLWRVTLDEAGRVLVYDSVHPCGCYHLFFPGARLELREVALALPEPPLVPQRAPALRTEERVVLRVSTGEHFLQRVYTERIGPDAGGSAQYSLAPYRELYHSPHPDGPRSLFDRHGIVPGTDRGERFYLWPMGVRAPGAMRERGRHATAFLGRRHFDDAFLLERLFRTSP